MMDLITVVDLWMISGLTALLCFMQPKDYAGMVKGLIAFSLGFILLPIWVGRQLYLLVSTEVKGA